MTFLEYVTEWDKLVEERERLVEQKRVMTEVIDNRIASITPIEMLMRKSIAESVKTALGAKHKEGVNRFQMEDGKTLKLTYSVTRTIEEAEIKNARQAYAELNDTSVDFDACLRVKYELAKAEWNKLTDAGKKALSRMITSKDAAPVVEFD